jgi:isopentenyl diphosphate isomerase/L-lactate dehydrogenase-like FMN-dependent dehydrogenase
VRASSPSLSRRRLLRYLAASPLAVALAADDHASPEEEPSASPRRFLEAAGEKPIAAAADALNVFDYEVVARHTLPPAHYGYIATGVHDDRTQRANREAFERIQIRARRLVDVARIDTQTELFGRTYETPIFLCPAASQRAFHPDGELAVARAARSARHLQMLSTDTTTAIEDVIAARGEPVFFQLYPTDVFSVTERIVKRAEAAGAPVLVLTVDLPLGTNRETVRRYAQLDTRSCTACHGQSFAQYVSRKPMYAGIDVSAVQSEVPVTMTWDFVKRLRGLTPMKLVLKGIVTREDAALAVEHGVDGLVVSNHGGRSEESGRAAIDCLAEVVDAVGGKIPVLMDSGVRRGTDVFKALALGARAVGIGRPYLWGLAAFGQEGVEGVLRLLRAELVAAMQTCGTPSLREIKRGSVTGAA